MNKKPLIGLLGGMAWPSTMSYYQILNEEAETKYGLNHSAECIIYSYDFDMVNATYREEAYIINQLKKGIAALLDAGAGYLILCSNTMHYYLDKIASQYPPNLFIDIRDSVGKYLNDMSIESCLLLGTKFTMKGAFYKNYLREGYRVNIEVPRAHEQEIIHSYIFTELINNKVSPGAIEYFGGICKGHTSVILGCTELQLLFKTSSEEVNFIDTTRIHAKAAFLKSSL